MTVVTCKHLSDALQEEGVEVIPDVVFAKHKNITPKLLADFPLTCVTLIFEIKGEKQEV